MQNLYGNKGKIWLQRLPKLLENITARFTLRELKPVGNLTYHYIAAGFQGKSLIILKLGLDIEALEKEALALQCFADHGAVKLIAAENGLLLLERAVPGDALKSYFPAKDAEAVAIVCQIMNKLHQTKIPKEHNFSHIKDWLIVLNKDWHIPYDYLQKARQLRDKLLATSNPDVLLHGDLHHDNILQNGADWLAIDPKGVIGEPAYEAAAFIRNPINELLQQDNIGDIINNRIACFAEKLSIPKTRIADWCFVQVVLAWIWALEDNCDVSNWKQLARIFDRMS